MNRDELRKLNRKIKALNILNICFWIINALLIIIPLWHYYLIGFKFDLYFTIITILNIIGFYLSYIITVKLIYYKHKYIHFTEKHKFNIEQNGK
jgi:hypothetical protein